MKRLVQLILISTSLISSNVFAGAPAEDNAKNNFSYNSPDDRVMFSAEKGKVDVQLQLKINDLKDYDRVVIEKSPTMLGDFKQVKTIALTDELRYSGAPIMQGDKATVKDVFYRVTTISKDGIARMYGPLEVPAGYK